jgi:hypothetical protein
MQGYRLTPIEFEKDDERNFHVEFVAAAANLRAQNYGIPATDKLEVECELPISLPFFFVLFPWSFFYMLDMQGLMLQSLPSPILPGGNPHQKAPEIFGSF